MAATLFVCIGDGVEEKDPEVIGDAVEKKHKNWIIVDSVEFGLERHQGDAEGGVVTRGFGKAVFNDVTFTSHIGRHTTALMLNVASGQRLKKVVIHQTKANEDQSQALTKYIIWTLEDAQINTYSISASSDDVPTESWAIRSAKMSIEYQYPKDGKGKLEKYGEFKWDIGKGEMG